MDTRTDHKGKYLIVILLFLLFLFAYIHFYLEGISGQQVQVQAKDMCGTEVFMGKIVHSKLLCCEDITCKELEILPPTVEY
jgi:hypothetical protein